MSYLALYGGQPVLGEGEGKFEWPLITDSLRLAVEKQLYNTLSIRDCSGVFREFEESFAAYHGRSHPLLSNSGTSSIFSMFEGIELAPGDEVIASVFSFHASASPAIYLGARVVFADINEDGSLSVESVERALSPRTRAVIVTHLWGIPARDLELLATLCRERSIYLFEDCSHAHGAWANGKPVGTKGHAAAWSLQGQKIISGGEGGIMLTDDQQIFERALLQGHYNRRTRNEISEASPMWRYFETGLGLKLRAHPVAIAIALEQFGHLDDFLQQKRSFAELLTNALANYEFLHLPRIDFGVSPSWYAFPILFDADLAKGVGRERFVMALHAEGLCEIDIPNATNMLSDLPLFQDPGFALGRRYPSHIQSVSRATFPVARKYASQVLKMPIWARSEDTSIMYAYVDGFRKVCDYIAYHGKL